MAYVFDSTIVFPVLGVDVTKVGTTQLWPLGMKVRGATYGKQYTYVKAGGVIAYGNLIKGGLADDPYAAVLIGTASAAANQPIGLWPHATSSATNDFAFIHTGGVFEDDAQVVSASVANGDPFVSDANGDCTIAAATDITNAAGEVLVDDTDNTGTVLFYAI